jgi:adhesin/invasin
MTIKSALYQRRFREKCVAWIILWLQLTVSGFLPLFSGIASASSLPLVKASSSATQYFSVYRLKPHETIDSISQRTHLSLQQLAKINQAYLPAGQTVQSLKPGQTLLLPDPRPTLSVTDKLPTLGSDTLIQKGKKNPPSVSTSAAHTASQPNTMKKNSILRSDVLISPDSLSNSVKQAGTLLSNQNQKEALKGYASGAVTQKAASTVQEWLHQFGTAQVNLSTSNSRSVNGSADLLVPLYDTPSDLLFAQLGMRRIDSRFTTNIGLGNRQFTDNWMWGYNAFFDRDYTGKNSRLGFGVESARDYVKFAANTYLRLTDWHQSYDKEDYDERVANGFDLRVEGYLPHYPQVGAKLMYEKYFGNNVALMDKDTLQKDPQAVTLGINYTPIPLVTFGIDQKQGNSGTNDTQFNLGVDYRLGVPLTQQLDPSAVMLQRRLSGSRYDLVNRNNQIVLDYHKRQVIALKFNPDTLVGLSGEIKPLTYQLKAEHGLDKIVWDDAALIAGGGALSNPSGLATGPYFVTLPGFTGTEKGYTLSATATDKKGNVSPRAEVMLVVNGSGLSVSNSGLVLANETLLANGQSTTTLTVNLKDSQNNPVSVFDGALTFQLNETINTKKLSAKGSRRANTLPVHTARISLPQETHKGSGVYTSTVTAGTQAGSVLITASANGIPLAPVTLTQIADTGTAHIDSSHITVTHNNAIANLVAMNTVVAKVTDANGSPVPNLAVGVTLTSPSGALQLAANQSNSPVTDPHGLVTINVVDGVAETGAVQLLVPGQSSAVSASITFAGDGSTAQVAPNSLQLTQDNQFADGVAENKVKVTVTDANGNPLSGQVVYFSATNHAVIPPSTQTDTQGIATVSLTNTRAGVSTITAMLNTSQQHIDAHFSANPATATLSADDMGTNNNQQPANGYTPITLYAIIKDAFGNVLSGQTVLFSADNAGVRFDTTSPVSDENGRVSVNLTSTTILSTVVTALVNGVSQHVTISFTADRETATITAANISLLTNNQIANGVDMNRVLVRVTDANNNPVGGYPVNFQAGNSAHLVATVVETNDTGEAIASLSNTQQGISTVLASLPSGHANHIDTTFISDASTAGILPGDITSTVTGSPANAVSTNVFDLIIRDAKGNPVSGQSVQFTTAPGVTITPNPANSDADGKIKVSISSIVAGDITFTPSINGHVQSPIVTTFVADTASAAISAITVSENNQLADGSAQNKVDVTVEDAHHNPVPNIAVTFTTNHGSSPTTLVMPTRSDGTVQLSLTNTTAGLSTVTAEVNGHTQSADTTFIADNATADIKDSNIQLQTTGSPADGTTSNIVRVTVTDAQNNPLVGYPVSFTASNGAQLTADIVNTDTNGEARASLTNKTRGISTVVASLASGRSNSLDTVFIGDSRTAGITPSDVTQTGSNIPADGVTPVELELIVRDANGNPVEGQSVSFASLAGVTFTPNPATTDAQGRVQVAVTSTVAGSMTITPEINGSAQPTITSAFVPDISTASIDGTGLSVFLDNSAASGTDVNVVVAAVKDRFGNLVPNVPVTFTAMNGALPAYQTVTTQSNGRASFSLTNLSAGTTAVTAVVGTTQAQTINVTFIADVSTAKIAASDMSSLTDNAEANGLAQNTVQVRVKDSGGNAVPATPVTFSATHGAIVTPATVNTDSQGIATVTLTNTQAGESRVVATVGGHPQSTTVTFIADRATASLAASDMSLLKNGSLANGLDKDQLQVVLRDANGNPVDGVPVTFSVSNGAILEATSVNTASGGVAAAAWSNTKAGVSIVTASVAGGAPILMNSYFVADAATARLTAGNVAVTLNNQVANGVENAIVKALVVDANNNFIPGVLVSFSADNSSAQLSASAVTTGDDGASTVYLTQTVSGVTHITATVNGSLQTVPVTFVGDNSTATLLPQNVAIVTNNQLADGRQTDLITLLITDANGNPVPGAVVILSATAGMSAPQSVVSDSEGKVSVAVSSTITGNQTVTTSLNGQSQAIKVNFIADSTTAHIASNAMTVTTNNQVANDVMKNAVQVIVTDALGNPVPDITVTFSSTAMVDTPTAITNSQGMASTTLHTVHAGTTAVRAQLANGGSQQVNVVFVSDASTATLAAGSLSTLLNNQVANGTAKNVLVAQVTDANGNPVAGYSVGFSADNSAAVVASVVTTDVNGKALGQLTNIKAGVTTVTATAGGGTASLPVTFVADPSTAKILAGGLFVTVNNAIADGSSTNQVTALVVDANNNPVSSIPVIFTASNGALITTPVLTDITGSVAATLTNISQGSSLVTAKVNTSVQSINTTFVPNTPTLAVNSSLITADRGTPIVLTATLMGPTGLPIINQPVQFSVTGAINRQGTSNTPTAQVNNNGIATVNTNSSGISSVNLTDAVGGLKTTLTIKVVLQGNTYTQTLNIIFTDPNITDVPGATLYGSGQNTITVNGTTFIRPLLQSETSGSTGGYQEGGKTWATFRSSDFIRICGGLAKVPSVTQLQGLATFINVSQKGWPTAYPYWTNVMSPYGVYWFVRLPGGGQEYYGGNGDGYLSCLK